MESGDVGKHYILYYPIQNYLLFFYRTQISPADITLDARFVSVKREMYFQYGNGKKSRILFFAAFFSHFPKLSIAMSEFLLSVDFVKLNQVYSVYRIHN